MRRHLSSPLIKGNQRAHGITRVLTVDSSLPSRATTDWSLLPSVQGVLPMNYLLSVSAKPSTKTL